MGWYSYTFFLRSILCLSLFSTYWIHWIVTQFFWGRGMIFTINLSDHLCEFIYLCFIQSVHYFLFSNRHHLKASSSIFFVMFEFRIWDWIPCFRAAQFRYGLLDKEKNAVGVTIANNNFIYSFLQLPRKRSAVICLWRRANNVTVVTNLILHAPGMTNVAKVAVVLRTLS